MGDTGDNALSTEIPVLAQTNSSRIGVRALTGGRRRPLKNCDRTDTVSVALASLERILTVRTEFAASSRSVSKSAQVVDLQTTVEMRVPELYTHTLRTIPEMR